MGAGVRQGCPLSPLLFVVAMDGLLRRFRREIPQCTPRAYADDTAIVLRDLIRDLPTASSIFAELAVASRLTLNFPKCILMPLGAEEPEVFRPHLRDCCPQWAGMTVTDKGKYLGVILGPGRGQESWSGPLQKAWERVLAWEWGPLGLQYSARVWNTFILPVLTFVAQVEQPPPAVIKETEAMLRKAAVGPRDWCTADDMYHLRRSYHFNVEFRDLRTSAQAAMLRVATWEDESHGGLRIRERARHLRTRPRRMQDYFSIARFQRFETWYQSSPLLQLSSTCADLTDLGVTATQIIQDLTHPEPRPGRQPIAQRARVSFQKAAHAAILTHTTYVAEHRVRYNLRRFGCLDRRQVDRSLRRLRELAGRVPPRVWAATHGVLWNRWATGRRRQRRSMPCMLGCRDGHDAIEHYAYCREVRSFAASQLGLQFRFGTPLEEWLLTTPQHRDAAADEHWWDKLALLQYAVNRATCGVRSHGGPHPGLSAPRLLRQATYEGARGNARLLAAAFGS